MTQSLLIANVVKRNLKFSIPSLAFFLGKSIILRFTERFGLEGTLKTLPWARTCPSRQGCLKSHPSWPWTPPRVGHLQLLWAICASATAPSKNFLLTSKLNLPSFTLKPSPLVLSLDDGSLLNVPSLEVPVVYLAHVWCTLVSLEELGDVCK